MFELMLTTYSGSFSYGEHDSFELATVAAGDLDELDEEEYFEIFCPDGSVWVTSGSGEWVRE